MKIFKKHKISDKLFKMFNALSNPVRYEIYVNILEEACECNLDETGELFGNCVSHISEKLELPQPTVSNHVKELMNAGLVVSVRRGKNLYLFGTEDSAQDLKNFGQFVEKEVYGHEHQD